MGGMWTIILRLPEAERTGTDRKLPSPQILWSTAAAPVVATLELVGGIALIIGLLARPIAALLTLDMIAELAQVHAGSGVFAATGGFELVLLLGAAALAIALPGAGRFAADRVLFAGRSPVLSSLA